MNTDFCAPTKHMMPSKKGVLFGAHAINTDAHVFFDHAAALVYNP